MQPRIERRRVDRGGGNRTDRRCPPRVRIRRRGAHRTVHHQSPRAERRSGRARYGGRVGVEMPVTAKSTICRSARNTSVKDERVLARARGWPERCACSTRTTCRWRCARTRQRYATTVFTALGCEGISRIDFLINADTNRLYFNEINTLPGSLAFYLWSAAPHYWTITELLTASSIERSDCAR